MKIETGRFIYYTGDASMKNECIALYSVEDIYEAFNMGLSSAVYVLEKTIELPFEDRLYLLECLKKIADCNEPMKAASLPKSKSNREALGY